MRREQKENKDRHSYALPDAATETPHVWVYDPKAYSDMQDVVYTVAFDQAGALSASYTPAAGASYGKDAGKAGGRGQR